MKYIHYFAALSTSFILAVFLKAGVMDYFVCLTAGALSAYLARHIKSGSELVYWISSIGTIFLITISNYGANFHRLVIILPFIFVCGYFSAKVTLRFRKQELR